MPPFYGGLCKAQKLEKIGILEISRLSHKLVHDDSRQLILEGRPPTSHKELRLTACDSYVSKGHLVRDYTLKTFSVDFSAPNDGSQSNLTAKIRRAPNDNQITIRGGRLKFIMKAGFYKTSAGRIIQEVSSDDGSKTIVYVKVDVGYPETVVRLSPRPQG